MGGLKTIATVATVAFVTTGPSLSAANGKEQQKLDGAAFLETFDDGLKGFGHHGDDCAHEYRSGDVWVSEAGRASVAVRA